MAVVLTPFAGFCPSTRLSLWLSDCLMFLVVMSYLVYGSVMFPTYFLVRLKDARHIRTLGPSEAGSGGSGTGPV